MMYVFGKWGKIYATISEIPVSSHQTINCVYESFIIKVTSILNRRWLFMLRRPIVVKFQSKNRNGVKTIWAILSDNVNGDGWMCDVSGSRLNAFTYQHVYYLFCIISFYFYDICMYVCVNKYLFSFQLAFPYIWPRTQQLPHSVHLVYDY